MFTWKGSNMAIFDNFLDTSRDYQSGLDNVTDTNLIAEDLYLYNLNDKTFQIKTVWRNVYSRYISFVWCFHGKTVHIFTFAFISTTFNPDGSQASDASGLGAELKDGLFLVILMGHWLPAVPYWAVWLPVIVSALARFIWSRHASKEYFSLKTFYIPWICNDQCIPWVILWRNALTFFRLIQSTSNPRNNFLFVTGCRGAALSWSGVLSHCRKRTRV